MSSIIPSPSGSPSSSPKGRKPPHQSRPQKSKSKSLSLPHLPRRFSLVGSSALPSPDGRRLPTKNSSPTILHSPQELLSPSKLPATDSMSYFPPFEDMGSDDHSDAPEADNVAGPSRVGSPVREERGDQHSKNKSLGSLANFMAWATFSPTTETPPPASLQNTSRDSSISGPTDGERVEALTRRFNSTQGKRRVLEPRAVEEESGGISLLGLTTTASKGSITMEGIKQKRRMGSEIEVERMIRAGKEHAARMSGEDEEGAVEHLVGWSPSRPRVQRSHFSLPPPSLRLPQWRFPIPSPPITSLSPHIPVEFFQFEILNPASASTSPTKPPFTFADLHQEDLDDIEGSLLSLDSGSGLGSDVASLFPTCTSQDFTPTRPSTPERSPPSHSRRLWESSPRSAYVLRKKGRFRLEGDDEDEEEIYPRGERMEIVFPGKTKLRRTSSSGSKASCDSNVTVKAQEGEVTPRAGKGWTEMGTQYESSPIYTVKVEKGCCDKFAE